MTPRPASPVGARSVGPARRAMWAVDDARRWRPTLPSFVVDRALRRGRTLMPAPAPDGTPRGLRYTVPAIERTRRAMLRTQAVMDPAPRVMRRDTVELPHCTAERLSLPTSRPDRTILYFHGGGFLRGQTDTHAGALARFMRAARAGAFSVDYRLAPEDAFPAWLDDGVDAWRHLMAEGVDSASIAIGGDSAGGGLTLGLLQRLRDEGLGLPACAFVVSPWADMTHGGASYEENQATEVMFGPGVIEHTADWIAAQSGLPADHPLLSPAFGDFRGLPPLRIDVSAREILRSDGERVAERYAAAGSYVRLEVHPSAPHAWTAIGVLRAARSTAREIGTFLDDHFPDRP